MKVYLVIFALCTNIWGGPTKVGNGDDGTDLEGFKPIESGIILETKKEAIDLIKKLNISGVANLGNLLPELENSKLYITEDNVSSKQLEEMGAFHSGIEGFVYARTFAKPYSPTRFFPVSLKLSKEQLIALHIHEALHRSLPEKYREDEKTVSKITLAISSPQTTFDKINEISQELMPEDKLTSYNLQLKPSKASHLLNPNLLEISYSKWLKSNRSFSHNITLPIDHSYNFKIDLFPFGEEFDSIGFGVQSQYVVTKSHSNFFGPLNLDFKYLFWTKKGFDFLFTFGKEVTSKGNLKMINTAYGRNASYLKIDAVKNDGHFNINLGFTLNSDYNIERNLENVKSFYSVGSSYEINSAILKIDQELQYGLVGKLIMLDSFKFEPETGARINKKNDQYFFLGPKIEYDLKNKYIAFFEGTYFFNSNKNAEEDYLRDLLGQAMGQWKFTIGLKYKF